MINDVIQITVPLPNNNFNTALQHQILFKYIQLDAAAMSTASNVHIRQDY
jgi:hypothetical protein